jgi:hypothetical protein
LKVSLIASLIACLSLFAMQEKTARPASSEKNSAQANSTADHKVHVWMKNVDFHLSDDIVVNIHTLDGHLPPLGNFEFPVFDDKNSFAIAVDTANISITLASLTNDLNEWVFGAPNAPLKNLKVSASGDKIKLNGSLVSKAGVPFESQGTLVLAPDGMIRVHTTNIKTAHLPVRGLMNIFGVETESLVNTSHAKGVTIDKDDMVLDPQKVLPPPVLQGHLTKVELRGQEIYLTFGPSAGSSAQAAAGNSSAPAFDARSDCGGRNFIAVKGGTIRFGKLTMDDADMQLVDRDPQNPFDFSADHYKEQLEAGYSKITSKFGLCAFVPDYNKIARHPTKQAKKETPAPAKPEASH